MLVSLIAAFSEDGFISQDGRIPWHLPRDIQHFRHYTSGKWLLLGRKTYSEMLGWFRGHTPLVLSHSQMLPGPGRVVHTVEEAIFQAESAGAPELVICGGGEVYAAALPWVRLLILTHVHTTLNSGVKFPTLQPGDWVEQERHSFPEDADHAYGMTILHLHRNRSPH